MQVQGYNFSDPRQTDIANKEINQALEKNKTNMGAFKVSIASDDLAKLEELEHKLLQNAMDSQHLLTKLEMSKYGGAIPEIQSAVENLKTRLKEISSQETSAAKMVDIDIGIHKLKDEFAASKDLTDLEALTQRIDTFTNKTMKTLDVVGKDEGFRNSIDVKECISRLNVLSELSAKVKSALDNRLSLKKLINDQLTDPQVQQFLVDQKIDFKEDWFVKEELDPKQKTDILVLAERVAQAHIDKGEMQKAIAVRTLAAQTFQPAGPLANVPSALKKEDPKLGIHLYPIDTGLFKNHDLMMQKRTFEGRPPSLHVESKLSHPARDNMESTLKFVTDDATTFHLALPKGFCKGVSVSEEEEVYYNRKIDGKFSSVKSEGFLVKAFNTKTCKVKVINFEGVGTVRIGISDPIKYESMRNRITIDLNPSISDSEAAEQMSIIFSALGLGAVASAPRPVDEERIKVLQLFRAFHPSEAYAFERDPNTFNAPIERLRADIEAKVPAMRAKLKRYLEDEPTLMYKQEVYPGQSVWCIQGVSNEVKKEGAIGLMSGVTAPNFTEATKRIVSIFKTGALSTQDRFQVGITISGDSSGTDLRTGGGGSVFARMLTDNMPIKPGAYPLQGAMQILYDLNLVDRVGYGYPGDQYGTKDPLIYGKRSNIIELTKKYKTEGSLNNLGNEVCINHRVGPEFIKGLLVADDNQKSELIEALRKGGLLTTNEKSEELINGVPVDQFIHVGNFDAKYWS